MKGRLALVFWRWGVVSRASPRIQGACTLRAWPYAGRALSSRRLRFDVGVSGLCALVMMVMF
ncbi:MAG: hypothetical protein CMH57_08195 [Myxococcales bacterium]|nr:hypothetical protein [Myxococcales bacterium]